LLADFLLRQFFRPDAGGGDLLGVELELLLFAVSVFMPAGFFGFVSVLVCRLAGGGALDSAVLRRLTFSRSRPASGPRGRGP